MICVSLGKMGISKCKQILKQHPFAEIRLDLNHFNSKEIKDIFSMPAQLIATCRPGPFSDEQRYRILTQAIISGSSFVDIEIESSEQFKTRIIRRVKEYKCRIIISYHNHEKVPPFFALNRIINSCFKNGAHIAKIACQVKSKPEISRLLSLYNSNIHRHKKLITIGMGELGKVTRLLAPFLGAPFTYASLSPGMETAEGQLDKKNLQRLMESMTGG